MRRFIFVLCVLAVLLSVGAVASAQDSGGTSTTHTVAAGENLFRISLRYNVSMAAIAAANNLTNVNLIYVGQVLTIPGASGTTPPPTRGGTTSGGTSGGDTSGGTGTTTTYTVVAGDTLGSIARRFNTTFQAIAAANNIANPNLIYVGQVLNISGGSGSTSGGTTSGGTTSGGTTSGGNTPPSTTNTSGFELGGQVFAFSHSDQMRGAGMTWAKIQIRWRRGEGTGSAQAAIDAARGRGFKVLLSVIGDKGELASNPTQYYQDFANYLGQVAALGPDGVEVWNEENIDREWPSGLISGGQYTQMLRAAYGAIKQANSGIMVISGAPSPTGFFGGCSTAGGDDNCFLSQMAAAGAASVMDCVGIHYNEGIVSPYATSGDPRGNSSHYTRYYQSMVNLYASTFPGKPLCFTELGYLSPQGYGTLSAGFSWAQNVTVANQAEWLQGAVTQARSSGRVRLLVVWNVDSTQFGDDPQGGYAIIRPDNTCPACNTLRVAMGL